ncbi:MAG: hypothetical protein ACKPKO_26805, partial [Candidatus Fonsibacter sp.]
LGSVRPPASWKTSDKIKSKKTDSSVDRWSDDIPAADIIRNFGIDSNIVFKPSDSFGIEDNSHGEFVKGEPVDEIKFELDGIPSACSEGALSARAKRRDSSYTECAEVNDWLIDTVCGHDLLSKQEVAHYKKFIHKAKSPTVFHTANG